MSGLISGAMAYYEEQYGSDDETEDKDKKGHAVPDTPDVLKEPPRTPPGSTNPA